MARYPVRGDFLCRPSRVLTYCHVADTDNNGTCYTCGGYIASRDAGRYI